ncbi:MAG TPA: TOPRIM nucleotidyl transferase/hydrolase domain-containing protein [Frankiaceae bacterium]|nr:TOPRIM nucleotidyl transferase/hydrolase domain-containing protein [Frankiaceae bacterium]
MTGAPVSTVVLVEGVSDQLAVETLAARLGRNLTGDGIAVVAMGGATNVKRHLDFFGPPGLDVRLAGLVDEGELRVFAGALERTGLGDELSPADMERLGFFVCVRDLEDELIRALGPRAVEQILHGEGDLHAFRTFQKQPEQRDRSDQARLRRFMGTRGGRKHRYATVLVNALELDAVPLPLDRLLAFI